MKRLLRKWRRGQVSILEVAAATRGKWVPMYWRKGPTMIRLLRESLWELLHIILTIVYVGILLILWGTGYTIGEWQSRGYWQKVAAKWEQEHHGH